mmetsp:Transcript_26037/g.52754  ORF Transcript_26037/g.52754 Transcript_26037/m.52754 type:complete len:85 (-) Transcript_26037:19-273(-)
MLEYELNLSWRRKMRILMVVRTKSQHRLTGALIKCHLTKSKKKSFDSGQLSNYLKQLTAKAKKLQERKSDGDEYNGDVSADAYV